MSAVLKAQEPGARYLAAAQPGLVRQFDLVAGAPGGVARLRELILTLAVHGKLVRQERADEPAAVLIERIRVEKHRLVAAGSVKRDRPLPAINDADLSSGIPIGWAPRRLVWKPTFTMSSGGRALWACGQVAPAACPHVHRAVLN